jgi:hypothetical protein
MKRIASAAAMTRVRAVRLTWSACAAWLELADEEDDDALEDEEGRAQRGQERAAAGPLQHPHRHLLDPQPLAHRQLQRLDLGEVGRVVLAEQRHHAAVGGAHAAGRVGEALAGRQGEEQAEDVDADLAGEGRLVVLALELGARQRLGLLRITGADHEVGAVGLHLGKDPRDLGGRMLAVGVQVGTEVVALAQRVEVAGLQRRAEALVEGQRRDQHAGRLGPRRGRVGRPVVDDEDVGAGQVGADVGDHGVDRRLLVPGRDEDESPHGEGGDCSMGSGHGSRPQPFCEDCVRDSSWRAATRIPGRSPKLHASECASG